MVTCWERANLLALLYVMFSCVFVTFLCGVLGQVWYLTLLTPDLCLLTYFEYCSFSLALNIKGFFCISNTVSHIVHANKALIVVLYKSTL